MGHHLFTRKRSGQSLVLAVLLMVVLAGFLGLVVDVGRLYSARQQLRAACDAAACAGATQLPADPDQALTDAVTQYCGNVGASVPAGPFSSGTPLTIARAGGATDTLTVTTPYDGSSARVRVTARRIVPSIFMQLLGTATSAVRAAATGTGGKGRKSGACILASAYSDGRTQPIRSAATKRADGNYYAMVMRKAGGKSEFGVDPTTREVVAPIATPQNVYLDTNPNTTGAVIYGDTGYANYVSTPMPVTAGSVSRHAFLDPSYYYNQAAAAGHVYSGLARFEGDVNGFYFVDGDITITKKTTGTATFVATGSINVTPGGAQVDLTSADPTNHVLFFAGAKSSLYADPMAYFAPGNPDFAWDKYHIRVETNNSNYVGAIYAPFGYVYMSGNHPAVSGPIIGDTVAIDENSTEVTYRYDDTAPLASGSLLTE